MNLLKLLATLRLLVFCILIASLGGVSSFAKPSVAKAESSQSEKAKAANAADDDDEEEDDEEEEEDDDDKTS